MRISTNMMFETGTSQLNNLQAKMARTQQQLAANRRILTPSDDPIAAARALEVTQSQSVNNQFAINRQNARASLSEVELALTGTTSLLQDVQSLVVKAGNAVLSPADRASLAVELEGHIEDLMGLANTADGNGNYLFAGFKSDTVPFVSTATGAQYLGDQGQRQLQVSASRQVAASDSGSSVFENNLTGNGSFVTTAAASNGGTGIVSTGAVSNQAALTGHNYQISFSVSGTPATTTYNVLDSTTGAPPVGWTGPQTFQSGQQISFEGVSFDIKGAPANGDQFTVTPSQKQSVFETMKDLLAALRAPSGNSTQLAALNNELNTAGENLASALDNVLSVRASVGSRLKELDTLDSAGEDLNIQYADNLSQLQDLDVAAAITEYTQQQFALEAAQKTFKSLSGLSLFNFIG